MLALLGLVAADYQCDPAAAQLLDLSVHSCYIEEGATRTEPVLYENVEDFLHGTVGTEAFAPGNCLHNPDEPPCRCLLPPGDICIPVTPLVSFSDCAETTINGQSVKSG